MDDVFLGVADVAKLIDRTPALVRYLADRGDIPTTRTLRGVRLFRRVDVELFLERRDAERKTATRGGGG